MSSIDYIYTVRCLQLQSLICHFILKNPVFIFSPSRSIRSSFHCRYIGQCFSSCCILIESPFLPCNWIASTVVPITGATLWAFAAIRETPSRPNQNAWKSQHFPDVNAEGDPRHATVQLLPKSQFGAADFLARTTSQ